LLFSSANAQPFTLEQMMQAGVQQCVATHGFQAEAACRCEVSRWVGMWNANDSNVWRKTGQATPHMRQAEAIAARQCGLQ
jgi:hypothetical protein